MQANLRKRLVFLEEVAVTSLQPHMVLLTRSRRTIFLAELTVSWDERLAISQLLKKGKYQTRSFIPN